MRHTGFSSDPPASVADVDARRAARELLVLRRGDARCAIAWCDDFPLKFISELLPPLLRTRLVATPSPR